MKKIMALIFLSIFSLCHDAVAMDELKKTKKKPALCFVLNEMNVQNFTTLNGMAFDKNDDEIYKKNVTEVLALDEEQDQAFFNALMNATLREVGEFSKITYDAEVSKHVFETGKGKFIAKITPLTNQEKILCHFVKISAIESE